MEAALRVTERQRRLIADALGRAGHRGPIAALVATLPAPDLTPWSAPGCEPTGRGQAVEPGQALIAELGAGEQLTVEQIDGGGCVDILIVTDAPDGERFNAARTRTHAGVMPTTGAVLVSTPPNERPLARIVEDTASGHDLLHAACSAAEYAAVGVDPDPSCAAVQLAALAALGRKPRDLGDPLNLWFTPRVEPDGTLDWRPTASGPGDRVTLEALTEITIVVNPCVDDISGCSAWRPRSVRVVAPGTPRHVGRSITWAELPTAVPAGMTADVARAVLVRWALAEVAQPERTGSR